MVRAAMIGTGGISKVHLEFLKSQEDVEISALCDVDEKNLRAKIDEYGGKAFADYNMMLDETSPDAVWVCTPPEVRSGPLLACAERNIPVFCEKPVGRDETKAEELGNELHSQGAKIQVGYCFRSMPSVQRLKQELERDKPHAFQSIYLCGVSLSRSLRAWYYDKDLSGGPLIDQATHNFDLLRFIFGEVQSVTGLAFNPVQKKQPGYTIDETISVSMTFERGLVGSHTHSWVGDGWRNEINISGEKAFYRINLNRGKLSIEEGAESHGFDQESRRIHDWQNIVFLEQVSTGVWRNNPSEFQDAVKSLKLTLACDRAIAAGRGC